MQHVVTEDAEVRVVLADLEREPSRTHTSHTHAGLPRTRLSPGRGPRPGVPIPDRVPLGPLSQACCTLGLVPDLPSPVSAKNPAQMIIENPSPTSGPLMLGTGHPKEATWAQQF